MDSYNQKRSAASKMKKRSIRERIEQERMGFLRGRGSATPNVGLGPKFVIPP